MDNLECISPCELIVLGTVAAVAISDDMDAGELNVLGNFVVAVGGLMLTWAAQKEFTSKQDDSSDSKDTCSSDQLEEIRCQLKALQEKYDKLECASSKSKGRSSPTTK